MQAMLDPLKWKYEDRVGLLVSTIAGAGLGIVVGYRSGNEWLGTFIWALIGAVVVGGAFYSGRASRLAAHPALVVYPAPCEVLRAEAFSNVCADNWARLLLVLAT